MRTRYATLIAIAAFLYMGGGLLFAGPAKITWQSGRVISAALHGNGPQNSGKWNQAGRGDLWWNYCISADNQCYSVVSREGPTKIGLTNNKIIKFSVRKNDLYIVSPNGKSYALRILRTDRRKTCP